MFAKGAECAMNRETKYPVFDGPSVKGQWGAANERIKRDWTPAKLPDLKSI